MAKKTEEIIEQTEEEVVDTQKKKNTTKKTKKKTLSEIRKILKDSEAVIINNDGAKIYYRDSSNGTEIELPEYGDTEIVEIEALRRMHVKHKSYFGNYWLLIVDFICDDESITLDDVYDYIGISKFYKDIENPNEDFFEELLLEVSVKEFKKILDKMNKELVTQLFNRATTLYKEGRFSDSFKIMALESKVDREDCFKDFKVEE